MCKLFIIFGKINKLKSTFKFYFYFYDEMPTVKEMRRERKRQEKLEQERLEKEKRDKELEEEEELKKSKLNNDIKDIRSVK